MDEQSGMKEKLLQEILEMFTKMADKEEGEGDMQKPGGLAIEVEGVGDPAEKKQEMC